MKERTARGTACPLCGQDRISEYRRVGRAYRNEYYELELGQCRDCGFVFLQNDPGIAYDLEYLCQNAGIDRNPVMARFRAEERLAGIGSHLQQARGRRLLDIGIGDGYLLSLAEKGGYETFGLDVNADGVRLARERYGLAARLSLGPLKDAFPDTTFDVIHMNEVIEHVREPMPMLSWCREHLKAGGCLVIQTGNIESLASQLKGSSWGYFQPAHTSYFSSRTLKFALVEAGFKVLRWASTDWRLGPSLAMTRALARRNRRQALGFLALYLTARAPNLRRTITVYAT
jgi:2-polyprenyl-3-methyl-5-hydroxy-6-metoxy-1,4-benzoquinol methylase